MAKTNDSTKPAFCTKQPFIYNPSLPRELDTDQLTCLTTQCSGVLMLVIEQLQELTNAYHNDLVDALFSVHDNVGRIQQMIDHAERARVIPTNSNQEEQNHG